MDTKIETADPASDDLAEREAAYEKFVWDNLKRNYLGNYLHGMLGMTGFRLVNAPTFLPAYLHLISGSNTVVGLGLALQQVGSVISPIFGATQIEHRTKVMPAAIWMGGLARVQIVGPLRQPELRLSSTPPLDPSDILSLIVFLLLCWLLHNRDKRVMANRAAKALPAEA